MVANKKGIGLLLFANEKREREKKSGDWSCSIPKRPWPSFLDIVVDVRPLELV